MIKCMHERTGTRRGKTTIDSIHISGAQGRREVVPLATVNHYLQPSDEVSDSQKPFQDARTRIRKGFVGEIMDGPRTNHLIFAHYDQFPTFSAFQIPQNKLLESVVPYV